MKLPLPRKRVILACHRWIGLLAAAFLLLVSLTGVALNHTETLRLDRIEMRAPLILDRYGMSRPSDIQGYRIHDSATIAHLGGQLFYNGEPIASAGEPVGIVSGDTLTVVATARLLLYLTPEGALIERVGVDQLPWKELQSVGRDKSDHPVFIADNGNWSPDSDWLTFEPHEGSYRVEPLTMAEPSKDAETELLKAYQGGGVSLYRVLLDLHSGRLFGWGGRTLMDLTAFAVILLVTSGIGGWIRKGRNHQRSNPNPESDVMKT